MRAFDPEVVDVIWGTVEPLLPQQVETHPLGCHRPRVPGRVCFRGNLIRLVTGASWVDIEAILDRQVSDTTLLADIGVLHLDPQLRLPAVRDRSASPASTSSRSNAAAPRCRASSGNRCASGSDGPLQVARLALVIRALRHGSRRTIGVAATALAALALLHLIWILVCPVPGDLLQPAREEPWRSA